MTDIRQDIEELMNAMMPFAKKMLLEHSEFFPFGGAMKPDGEIVNVAGYDGREQPSSDDIINLLQQDLRKDAVISHSFAEKFHCFEPNSHPKSSTHS